MDLRTCSYTTVPTPYIQAMRYVLSTILIPHPRVKALKPFCRYMRRATESKSRLAPAGNGFCEFVMTLTSG
jgi:hypothetical protein